ncbi:hypothetical protein [Bryobacter aggregatus]|uniref:hypothetical protein n=1 Tax=Bryobacter aggregatus TaxID=360054 RepID=UPI001EE183BC|nr:hypothetical protein [Bryobacter aggregatus]
MLPLVVQLSCAREEAQTPASARVVVPEYSAANIAPSGAAPFSPGRIVSLYGKALGPAQPCQGSAAPDRRETASPLRPKQTEIERSVFPQTLCDTEVRVGRVAAGLLYVSSGQINFKVPQSALTSGDTTVQVIRAGVSGPIVRVALGVEATSEQAQEIADAMWSALQKVDWDKAYSSQCAVLSSRELVGEEAASPTRNCKQIQPHTTTETLYYPVGAENPKEFLLRADIRPLREYPELSAEVEQILLRRLGTGVKPGQVPGVSLGAPREVVGSWRHGNLTLYVHRNPAYLAPLGVRRGVVLVALREELVQEQTRRALAQAALQTQSQLSPEMIGQDLSQSLGGAYRYEPVSLRWNAMTELERVAAEQKTRRELVRMLRWPKDDREQKAASYVAADELTRRLGSFLVRSLDGRTEEAGNFGQVKLQLAAYGVKYSGIGHYSDVMEYDYSLLKRAWTEYPDTKEGQRAFLLLQRLECAATDFLVKTGADCYREVIQKGEAFLAQYPDTVFRKEELALLATAYETEWSLWRGAGSVDYGIHAKPSAAAAEAARLKAIALYEELLRLAPGSPEAERGVLLIPRLKLKLDTGQRRFLASEC